MSKGVFFRVLVAGVCVCSMSANAESFQSGPNLQSQYAAIVEKANNYQEYKVIKEASLRSLWHNANDSLNKEKKNVMIGHAKIAAQQKTIDELQKNLTAKNQNLQETQNLIDNLSLLGISISKKTYNTIMWGLVLGLAGALAYFVFRNKSFRKEAYYRIHLFEELTEEFKNFKVKANEKEKRLARELQTERNAMEEMLSRR